MADSSAGGPATEPPAGLASEPADREEARRQGVDFWAIGNEPPWILRIDLDGRIVLEMGYEKRRFEFPTPEPVVDRAAGRTTYRTSARGMQLTVVIEDRSCRDTMSGEAFPAAVAVRLDDHEYRGCGRPTSPEAGSRPD